MKPALFVLTMASLLATTGCITQPTALVRQVTDAPHGHILTNINVWSPDSQWIVYDVRSDLAGSVFDGNRIEIVNAHTGEVKTLYESHDGAHCGVATYDTVRPEVIFILGPENPTPDFDYAANRRRGVMVRQDRPGVAIGLDARDLVSPFTPGALRGGTHVHVFSPDGKLVSFTYQDFVLSKFKEETPEHQTDIRNVGVSVVDHPVRPLHDDPRNHAGTGFTVLVTRTTAHPRPGSGEISRAYEEGWVGRDGYVRPDGTRQHRALAFQGDVLTTDGQTISEVFIVDLPDDLTIPGKGSLQGTATHRPFPPAGTQQRRLTFTAARRYPGIQGPRHWLRSAPDGSQIAFLMKDDAGIVQLWTISPSGGSPRQLTHNPAPIASAISWSPDGRWIAHIMDGSVCITDAATGQTHRLTPRAEGLRPEACVFSPDGRSIAYTRTVDGFNQVFVAELEGAK